MTAHPPASVTPWIPFVHRRDIFWGDTDPAKIAYTGRFADFVLEAVESFYRARLGTDWSRMTFEEELATSFAHLEFDFKSPVTAREPLAITVRVEKIGRSSVSYSARARGAETGEIRFTAAATNVWVNSGTLKPIAIPQTYRARLEVEQAMSAQYGDT